MENEHPAAKAKIITIPGERTDRRGVTTRLPLALATIAAFISLPIMLVGAQQGDAAKAAPTKIHIAKDSKTVKLDGAEVSPDELAKKLAAKKNKQRVVITADRDTPLARVTSVFAILSKAGVENVSFGKSDGNTAAGGKTVQLDVTKLEIAPPGRYALNLVIEGETVNTEFEIKDGVATCTKSEKAPGERVVEGAKGEFYPGKNGVFMIRIRGKGYTASQAWVFQSDGSAHVKEIPDRNENQRAVPIAESENDKE